MAYSDAPVAAQNQEAAGLSCWHYEDSAEKCSDFAFPEHFGSLAVFANRTDKQFRSYVQARYEKAFAYYRQEFCKGRAF